MGVDNVAMADDADRQQQIEERKFKKEVDSLYGKSEVRVQQRRIQTVYNLSCPKKRGLVSLSACKKCDEFKGTSMDGKHVYCGIIKQSKKSVMITE